MKSETGRLFLKGRNCICTQHSAASECTELPPVAVAVHHVHPITSDYNAEHQLAQAWHTQQEQSTPGSPWHYWLRANIKRPNAKPYDLIIKIWCMLVQSSNIYLRTVLWLKIWCLLVQRILRGSRNSSSLIWLLGAWLSSASPPVCKFGCRALRCHLVPGLRSDAHEAHPAT